MARDFPLTSAHNLIRTSTNVTAVPLTLACWFKSDNATINQTLISIVNGATNTNWFRIDARSDATVRAQAVLGATTGASSVGTYLTTAWGHCAGVFTSATSRTVYFNGTAGTPETTSVTPTGLTDISVGRRSSAGTDVMDGKICEIGLWDVALTAGEIQMLAMGISPQHIRSGNLKGYWPVNGGSPEPDLSGNGQNLTVNLTTIADHAPVAPMFAWGLANTPYIVAGTSVPVFMATYRQRRLA